MLNQKKHQQIITNAANKIHVANKYIFYELRDTTKPEVYEIKNSIKKVEENKTCFFIFSFTISERQ